MITLLLLSIALLSAVSVPLAAGLVGPNRLYGFRTPRTLADDRVWYPVNRMAGRRTLAVNAVVGALALLGWFGFVGTGTVLIGALLLGVGALLAMFVSAASITAQIDAGGPKLDLSSSLSRKQKDSGRQREKLLDRLSR